jgi:aminopeptidase N
MNRILGTLALLILLVQIEAQVYHSCPAHPPGDSYENPLYEQWLSAYDVKHYLLSLEVSNLDTRIEGVAEVLLEATRELDTLVMELQDGLTVSEIFYSDELSGPVFPPENELDFEHFDNAIYIILNRTRNQGEFFRVRISYGGDAGQDRGFFAGITHKKESTYGFDVTYTLSEPMNAKDWFPVKQVLEDKIDSVTFRLICDKDLLAGSNGLLEKIEDAGNEHILTWKTQYPMAYYLIAFAVADYMDYSFYAPLSNENDTVLVQNYLYDTEAVLNDWKEKIDRTGDMISLFSQLLVDYPFAEEKYGHMMAPLGGGMEHQTMSSMHSFGFSLVAHELAHQWFGDYITCGNWQDIWINEGFASYMEYVAAQYIRDQDAADLWMERAMSVALSEQEGSVYVPEEEVEDVYRLFSYGLSYKKGAILLHMIRFILDDDELFFEVMRSYLDRYKNGLATGADFQAILEEVSEMDFSCFFEQWYYVEGYPVFLLYWEQQGDSLLLRSEQTGTAAQVTPLFQIPFEIEIVYSNQQSQRVRLTQESSEDEFSLAVDGMVDRIIFDPDNHLLKTATVIQRIPTDQPFRYGPNPVSSELTIQFTNASLIDAVRITSFSGQEIFKTTDAENPLILDLSTYADGPYLLELTSASKSYLERILKISAN